MAAAVTSGDDVLEQAAAWRAAGRGVVLATLVEAWGSAPCPAGSQLAVDESGVFLGSVSGGCVEGAVIDAAGQVLRSGHPRLLEFGIPDAVAWSVGLACGGRIRVYLERID